MNGEYISKTSINTNVTNATGITGTEQNEKKEAVSHSIISLPACPETVL